MKIFRTVACVLTVFFMLQSAFVFAANNESIVATTTISSSAARQNAQAARRAAAKKRLQQRLDRRKTIVRTARVTCSLKFEKTEQGVKKLLEGITQRFAIILGARGKVLLAEPYSISQNTATNNNVFPMVGSSRLDLSLYVRDGTMEQRIQDEVGSSGCTSITWQ